jgi:large subunit ribosomal protein L3
MPGLIGRKVGMTQVFEPDGKVVPVTILEARPNTVVRTRTLETDGYVAIQIGAGERKPKHTSKPLAGYLKAQGVRGAPHLARVRGAEERRRVHGRPELTVATFEPGSLVDGIGTKGKGFQGVMKRYNLSAVTTATAQDRGTAGWGRAKTRSPEGEEAPGRMGGVRQTVRNLKVVAIRSQFVGVLGAVPGPMNGTCCAARRAGESAGSGTPWDKIQVAPPPAAPGAKKKK